MKKMTKGEIETLRIILRFGGKVFVSMGRKNSPQDVRTSTVNSLIERGFIRLWTAPKRVSQRGYRYIYEYDYAVTSTGCLALDQQ